MDGKILQELFRCYIRGLRRAGQEKRGSGKAQRYAQIPEIKTGRYGQLLEWMEGL